MSRLNYHHLYYFWQVARSGNLTRAANSLHVSQSALSAQIRQLESSLDCVLFERAGRRLQLTAAGHKALEYANEIFSRGEELEAILREGIEPARPHLRIGVLSNMSRNFIESFIAPLLDNREVRFSLHARGLTELLQGLSQHQFDLVLSNNSVTRGNQDPLWQSQLLARQPLVVVGPPGRIPAGAFPQGYEGSRWVAPGSTSELRSIFEAFCARHGYTPEIIMEADDMAMLRLLARDSGALSVLPEVVVRDEIRQGMLCQYMTLPNAWEQFYAITLKGQRLPEALRLLLGRWVEETVAPAAD
ncbi:LysR family transcriptional regulator [Pseudomonas sp.]|uniref:LysR family transcriptional regulator n=1 Tax=Pseudomonas sp. TaxID=306 RepID=UPI00272D1F4C|nr:LysR family transcriptional regulator [Pseudomonas sp.]